MLCQRVLIILAILLLSSCTVGPDYVKPPVAVPAKFKEATTRNWKVAQPQDNHDRGAWWTVFNDARLNDLEKQASTANQTIVNADANYRQALALVDEARASYFPTATIIPSITRQKKGGGSTAFISTSSSGATTTGTAATGSGGGGSNSSISTTHSLAFAASWEPDLWGSISRTVEASRAGAAASNALLASTKLSAQGSLAQIYFQVRALDKDQQLLDRTVIEYRKALQLTQFQYASGVAARADIVQAQSQLEMAEAQAINNKISRAQCEHAMAVLVGKPPAEFSLLPMPLAALPPRIPLALPSTLLERRPDVAQAERLMAQANAQIGVAIAAYFPTLTLSATGSVTNSGYAHWFSIPALGWALGPQLAETILDGGLRKATTQAARAGYDATVASYRQIVLAAFQDVEDNLASLHILEREAIAQNKAAQDARNALQLVLNQYKAGTVAYANVITAQTAAYTAEKNAADITGLRMTSAVGLIKALGGGWGGTLP